MLSAQRTKLTRTYAQRATASSGKTETAKVSKPALDVFLLEDEGAKKAECTFEDFVNSADDAIFDCTNGIIHDANRCAHCSTSEEPKVWRPHNPSGDPPVEGTCYGNCRNDSSDILHHPRQQEELSFQDRSP